MAAAEVPQTLEYMGGQLNVTPVIEVENFTNWKKSWLKEAKRTGDERKAANLDHLKDSSRRVLKGSAVQKQLTKLNATNMHKLELRPTKDFKAKYNKVKAKLALLSSSASASKAVTIKNKGLIAKAYE
ncbi:hypothetical protein Tco_1200393 [Tanacetum coccineum]